MDSIDLKILRTLQSKPEISIQELADTVGLSHTPCWRRLKRLEQDGVIKERAVILEPRLLNLSVTVYAALKIKNQSEETLEAFERATLNMPEIVECFSMSGDSDYILRIVVDSIERYESLLKRELLHMPGVSSISSSFALKCVKMTTKLPI